MKIITMNVPILDNPKVEVALTLAILQEICDSSLYYDSNWANQIGNPDDLIDLLGEMVENGLFRSVRGCVTKVTIHTLTLTLNLPQIFTLISKNYSLFINILNQLETVPSNRYYSDSVCFLNPKSRPKYCDTLQTFVKTYLCWVDIVKPVHGHLLPTSRFDQNMSTGKNFFVCRKLFLLTFYPGRNNKNKSQKLTSVTNTVKPAVSGLTCNKTQCQVHLQVVSL